MSSLDNIGKEIERLQTIIKAAPLTEFQRHVLSHIMLAGTIFLDEWRSKNLKLVKGGRYNG